MIPRPQSIFSAGEDGFPEAKGIATPTTNFCSTGSYAATSGTSCQTRGMSRSSELQVGLKLLIQCASSSSSVSGSYRSARSAIVMKSSLRPVRATRPSPSTSSPAMEELSFLKACRRCNKELSPQKDVYIYMGDQAFCSVECRSKQMLRDERREFEESFRRVQLRAANLRRRAAAAAKARDGVRPGGGCRRIFTVAAA